MKNLSVMLRRAFYLCLVMPLVLTAGCSGINASKSISPLDFLLPGITGNDSAPPPVPEGTNAFVSREYALR